jgi:hypothetical protein
MRRNRGQDLREGRRGAAEMRAEAGLRPKDGLDRCRLFPQSGDGRFHDLGGGNRLFRKELTDRAGAVRPSVHGTGTDGRGVMRLLLSLMIVTRGDGAAVGLTWGVALAPRRRAMPTAVVVEQSPGDGGQEILRQNQDGRYPAAHRFAPVWKERGLPHTFIVAGAWHCVNRDEGGQRGSPIRQNSEPGHKWPG